VGEIRAPVEKTNDHILQSPEHTQRMITGAETASDKEHTVKRQLAREHVGEEWYEYIPLAAGAISGNECVVGMIHRTRCLRRLRAYRSERGTG
jgi:hypothetical protein